MDPHDVYMLLVAAMDNIEKDGHGPEVHLRSRLWDVATEIAPQFSGSITRCVAQDLELSQVEVPDTMGLFDFVEVADAPGEPAVVGPSGGYAQGELVVLASARGGSAQAWGQPLTEQALRTMTGIAEAERLNGTLTAQTMGMVDYSRGSVPRFTARPGAFFWEIAHYAMMGGRALPPVPSPPVPPAMAEANYSEVELRVAAMSLDLGEPRSAAEETPETELGGFPAVTPEIRFDSFPTANVSPTGRTRSAEPDLQGLPAQISAATVRSWAQRDAETAWIEGRGPVPAHIDPWDYAVNYTGALARKIDDYRQVNAPIRRRAQEASARRLQGRRQTIKGKPVFDAPGPLPKRAPGRWDF